MQTNYYPTTVTPQRAPIGSEMNHLYLSPAQQQMRQPGIFLKRNERIDWRRIAAVDVDRIAREMDFQVLQDNLEQITLCNIDAEVDSRSMDPNFIKLYKMAQLIIEYLLLCQDQITTQYSDYEQLKNRSYQDQEDARQYIERLKNDLTETKKESKKRRKMLETQQRMLMAQNSNYHTCPVCTHAFLSVAYLQAHMARRHPDYKPIRRQEHDIDVEKEIRRYKEELNKKENELQSIKAQKRADDDIISNREATIRRLTKENQELTTRIAVLDDRFSQTRPNAQTRSPSPRRHESGTSGYAEIEQLKQELQQAKNDRRKEEKVRLRYEQENRALLQEVSDLKENLQTLKNNSGDSSGIIQELMTCQTKYNEEKAHRKRLEDQLEEAHNQLAQYRNQAPPPSSVIDRKSPTLPGRPDESPVPTRPIRLIQPTEIILTNYCPNLVERVKTNPKFLTKYRDNAKRQFVEELEEYENLGITEADTRLTDLDCRTKMDSVLQTRRYIQDDLPEFENIRANLNRTLEKLVNERLDVRRSITSIRSTGSKLVTFQDEQQRKRPTSSIYDSTKSGIPTTTHANESDDDETHRGSRTNVQPAPRKNLPASRPTSAVDALVSESMRPKTAATSGSTISTLVNKQITKATPITQSFGSDSENESPVPSALPSPADKKRAIDQKLQEANTKGPKAGVSNIVQVFPPVRGSTTNQNNDDNEDDDQTETFTTLQTNPPGKAPNGHLPQLSGRESMNNNHLSSGDVSQYTYDSLWKSQPGKGAEYRRPATADSAKTSNIDSDDNLDGEESN